MRMHRKLVMQHLLNASVLTDSASHHACTFSECESC